MIDIQYLNEYIYAILIMARFNFNSSGPGESISVPGKMINLTENEKNLTSIFTRCLDLFSFRSIELQFQVWSC